MATPKPDENGIGKQQEVIEGLHKAGTLKRSTVVHVLPSSNSSSNVLKQQKDTPDSGLNGWKPLSVEERTVVLSDNTQIIVESQNEFVFMGPSGARIVLSCLPLFCIPDKVDDASMSAKHQTLSSSSSSVPKNMDGWISFTQSIKRPSIDSQQVPSVTDTDGGIPPVEAELPGDLFTIVDPFEVQETEPSFSNFESSTRDNLIDDAFEKATKTTGTSNADEEDRNGSLTDSDDNIMNTTDGDDGQDIQINYVSDVNSVNKARTASVSFMSLHQVARSSTLIPTSLPPPPKTHFPRYTERGGWLIKLSHQKGMFGDRWQKRYFILNGPRLSYFKKYGDTQPRGVVSLIPGAWCKSIPQGTPRMADAVAKTNRSGVISVNRCLAVHKPSNYASTLSAMVASEGVADAFNSQTIALSNPQDSSRTFYMIAASEQERHAWTDAINENIDAYKNSQEALDVACDELKNILKAVGSCIPSEDLPSVLLAIHTKREAMFNVTT